MIVCGGWTVGLLVIQSAGTPELHATTGFITYAKDYVLLGMLAYYIFGLIWILQFVVACQHMVMAGAVSTWYFAK